MSPENKIIVDALLVSAGMGMCIVDDKLTKLSSADALMVRIFGSLFLVGVTMMFMGDMMRSAGLVK